MKLQKYLSHWFCCCFRKKKKKHVLLQDLDNISVKFAEI
jgi:hypothetical protein